MNTAKPDAVKSKARRAPRGQAMVEYSVVSHFLLIGGGMLLLPLVTKLFESLSKYYESIYYVLKNSAI